jgi:hypothetical protein
MKNLKILDLASVHDFPKAIIRPKSQISNIENEGTPSISYFILFHTQKSYTVEKMGIFYFF